MRLWSLHPRYLDTRGLSAVWREALLAQKVLQGGTRGYTRHPQLRRFQAQPQPLAAIAAYLRHVQLEAARRRYRFDASKIGPALPAGEITIPVTTGQLLYEWQHLMSKLAQRAPGLHAAHASIHQPDPHPIFHLVPGGIESWEVAVSAHP